MLKEIKAALGSLGYKTEGLQLTQSPNYELFRLTADLYVSVNALKCKDLSTIDTSTIDGYQVTFRHFSENFPKGKNSVLYFNVETFAIQNLRIQLAYAIAALNQAVAKRN